MGQNCLSIPKLQWYSGWSFRINKYFIPNYWAYWYLSLLDLTTYILHLSRTTCPIPWEWFSTNKSETSVMEYYFVKGPRAITREVEKVSVANVVEETCLRHKTMGFTKSWLGNLMHLHSIFYKVFTGVISYAKLWPDSIIICFTNILLALQNNLVKIHNARNHIYGENFKLKLYTCAQSHAFGHIYKISAWKSRTKYDSCNTYILREYCGDLVKCQWNSPWWP